MSKRDKAKAARDAAKAAIQAGRTAASFADVTSFPLAEIEAFLAKKNDGVALATALAADLGVDLPNIEVMDFRKSGFVPEALLNYLSLLGWNPGGDEEIWAVADMVERFDLPDVGRSAARFDYDKLRAMNGTWLRKLPREQILAHLASFHEVRSSRLQALDAPTLDRVLDLFLPRARTFVELAHQASQLLDRPASYDAKSLDKHVRPDAAFLPTLADGLASLDDWTPAGLEAGLNALAASTGVGLGKIAQPLRVALTGSSASPSIHDCLALVGQGETLARVNALRAAVSA
jgi:glutamyl/glutaminyl-tRNA synthetase